MNDGLEKKRRSSSAPRGDNRRFRSVGRSGKYETCRRLKSFTRRRALFDELQLCGVAERAVVLIARRQQSAMDLRNSQLRADEDRQSKQKQRWNSSEHDLFR